MHSSVPCGSKRAAARFKAKLLCWRAFEEWGPGDRQECAGPYTKGDYEDQSFVSDAARVRTEGSPTAQQNGSSLKQCSEITDTTHTHTYTHTHTHTTHNPVLKMRFLIITHERRIARNVRLAYSTSCNVWCTWLVWLALLLKPPLRA